MIILRPRSDYRCRSLELAMTAKDEAVFSEALRAEIPHIGFMSSHGDLMFRPNAVEFEGSCRIVVPPDAEWWKEVESHPWIVNHLSLHYCARPYTSINFFRSRWTWSTGYGNHNWAWDPPTLDVGFISTCILKDGLAEVAQQVEQVWKVAKRVGARCLVPAQLPEEPLPPDRRPRTLPGTHPQPLVGFDAAAWCRVAPRRMINGYGRPSKYWEPPRSAWYDTTAALMEQRYGDLLANPESEPRVRETETP
jgi:hypothetical protein